MINPPVFPVSTPQAFHDLLLASASKDPNAMKTFAAANPEIAAFGGLGQDARPGPAAMRRSPINSLNSFIFTDGSGAEHAVRWSLLPAAQPVPVSPDDLAKARPELPRAGDHGAGRTAGPQRWTMVVTVANPGDPTADPSKAWPQEPPHRRGRHAGGAADRSRAGRPVPRHQFRSDRPAAGHPDVGRPVPGRALVRLRKSYDLRTAEAKDYPRTEAAKP